MPEQSSRLSFACGICQKPYRRSPSHVKLHKSKFCSRACQGISKRRSVELTCAQCGTGFSLAPGDAKKRARAKSVYCSRRCMGLGKRTPWTAEKNFWPNVSVVDDDTSCWEYQRRNAAGYGVVKVNGRQQMAHRASWRVHFGPIPEGLFVCHRCDNPPCVRPDHLFLGTAADNSADMVAKGRSYTPSGDDHYSRRSPEKLRRGNAAPRSILNEDQVRLIRQQYADSKPSMRVLGEQYGVCAATIGAVVRRTTWGHLP
jgi:hypothetical protein